MNVMKDEVNLVKDLPSHLKSLDIEAIGSLVCDRLGFYMLTMKAAAISEHYLISLFYLAFVR